eukprot:5160557-Pleurochrysis_carterae.AAC.1
MKLRMRQGLSQVLHATVGRFWMTSDSVEKMFVSSALRQWYLLTGPAGMYLWRSRKAVSGVLPLELTYFVRSEDLPAGVDSSRCVGTDDEVYGDDMHEPCGNTVINISLACVLSGSSYLTLCAALPPGHPRAPGPATRAAI